MPGHFYEMAELNAAFKFSLAEKIINDAFEVCNEDEEKLNSDVNSGAGAGGGSVDVYSVLLLTSCVGDSQSYIQVRQECSV